jgi:hypothetical protein
MGSTKAGIVLCRDAGSGRKVEPGKTADHRQAVR